MTYTEGSGKHGRKKKKKQPRPYSPPKFDEADNVPFLSIVDPLVADKLRKLKGKSLSR